MHSPLWPDESRCLGAQKREGASSSSAKREVEQPEHRKGRNSSRRRTPAAKQGTSPKVGRAVPCTPLRLQFPRGGAHSPRRASCMTRPTKEDSGCYSILVLIAFRELLMPFPSALDYRFKRLELRLPTKFLLDSRRGSDESGRVARSAWFFDGVDFSSSDFMTGFDYFSNT